jgi:hypothetical protein
LKKNTAHLTTLFALSNLWMARRKLLQMLAVDAAKAVIHKHRAQFTVGIHSVRYAKK